MALTFLCGCAKQSAPEEAQTVAAQSDFQGQADVVRADLERLTRALYANDLNLHRGFTGSGVFPRLPVKRGSAGSEGQSTLNPSHGA
jgi:hypothetical protein